MSEFETILPFIKDAPAVILLALFMQWKLKAIGARIAELTEALKEHNEADTKAHDVTAWRLGRVEKVLRLSPPPPAPYRTPAESESNGTSP